MNGVRIARERHDLITHRMMVVRSGQWAMMAYVKVIGDRLREGQDLLRRGAWGEARRVFAAALAESTDALVEAIAAEGVAGAAWWLDDDAEVTERYEQGLPLLSRGSE
jgi:hypothetical protein